MISTSSSMTLISFILIVSLTTMTTTTTKMTMTEAFVVPSTTRKTRWTTTPTTTTTSTTTASSFSSSSSILVVLKETAASHSSDEHRIDYLDQLDLLGQKFQDIQSSLKEIKEHASHLMELELEDPNLTDLGGGEHAQALRQALADAKAAVDVYGANSPQAQQSWTELDAIADKNAKDVSTGKKTHPSYRYSAAALRKHHYYNAAVDPALLRDSIQALEQLESLQHFVTVEKKRLEQEPAFYYAA